MKMKKLKEQNKELDPNVTLEGNEGPTLNQNKNEKEAAPNP